MFAVLYLKTRYHHIWDKEAAKFDEMPLLGLRQLPFGEGGGCETEDDC